MIYGYKKYQSIFLLSILMSLTGFCQNIVGYEYSFNNGANLQYVSVASPSTTFNLNTNIDVSMLTNSLNVLHIRFKDNTGKWSVTKSHLFMKGYADSPIAKQIVGYEYAFNNGQNLTYLPVTPGAEFNLLANIDVSMLTNALNVLHIRFKDNTGKWSVTKSHLFMKGYADPSIAKQIVGYEYAFNNGQNLTYLPVTPGAEFNLLANIDVSMLTNAINVLHIRFKDNTGKWSVTKSHLFVKPYMAEQTPNNKIVEYYYWFDNNVGTKQTISVNPIDPLVVTTLDMSGIWEGSHHLHTQYKDIHGKHSVVTTNVVHKNPFPVAKFSTDKTHVCVGQRVEFSDAGSVDYNNVLYNFGNSQTATQLNTTHTYTQAGVFTVTLTVTHTASGLSATATKVIHVFDNPLNTVSVSESVFPVCFGTPVTLTADAIGANYLWSNGATTRSITVTQGGTYSVEIKNASYAGCSVVSNPIQVNYWPEINKTITLQDFPLFLIANQANATYQWIDCTNGNTPISGATQASFQPTLNGNYAVQINQNGCTVTSSCIAVSTVSVPETEIQQLVRMFPNPTWDNINVYNDVNISLSIFNSNGIKVWEGEYPSGKNRILLEKYSSGFYFIKVTATSGSLTNQQALFKILKL